MAELIISRQQYRKTLKALISEINDYPQSKVRQNSNLYIDLKPLLLVIQEYKLIIDNFAGARPGSVDHLSLQDAIDSLHSGAIYAEDYWNESAPFFKDIIKLNKSIDCLGISFDDYMLYRDIFGLIDSVLLNTDIHYTEDEQSELDYEYPVRGKLRKIVPTQKIAPVQFDIVDDRLVVAHKAPKTAKSDAGIARSAMVALTQQGKGLIEQLKLTNCDGRLLENISNLQEKLESNLDIVQLGILNIGAEIMSAGFKEELPEAVYSMLMAQTTGISLYVAQFPEWAKFQENAAKASFTDADVRQVEATARNLISQLKAREDAVDPEVPRTIQFLLDLVQKPGATAKKTAYALVRTIENLVAKVFSYGVDLIDGTIKTTIGYAKHVISLYLIGMAVESAQVLSPITEKMGDAKWMGAAAKLIKDAMLKSKEE